MGLIILVSGVCALAILAGVEFIRTLLRKKRRLTLDSEPADSIRYYGAKMSAAIIWTGIWSVVSGIVIVEFITNSQAYF